MEQSDFDFYVSKNPGWEIFVSPQWRFDKLRIKLRRLCKKGYYKRIRGNGFGDHFARTAKEKVANDSLKKPIEFSHSKFITEDK